MTEQGSGSERKGTRVTFLDQTGAKSVDAVIADTVVVRRILPNIITKMNLPVTGPDGQPMSYSLDHKEGGKRLREDQTLPVAQVGDGDHLIVYPEIVAG
ncbi:MAG: EsaB/YukD family protein [Pirellulaceae bacterium]|nr:EsaB/YukD family protein [Pirellulaceae bacterium]